MKYQLYFEHYEMRHFESGWRQISTNEARLNGLTEIKNDEVNQPLHSSQFT